MFILAGYLVQQYFKNEPLLSPCEGGCSFFIVRAYEPTGIKQYDKEFTVEEPKFATVTAYSCIGITDKYHLEMNCPSLKYSPRGRTSNGTEPIPYKTMACDKANMGKTFHLLGVGDVKCTDTGGAIKGSGRFDLYVSSINKAYKHGKQQIQYWEVK
jgi:3D (Asp-Asp-Asp) domain-containing protein